MTGRAGLPGIPEISMARYESALMRATRAEAALAAAEAERDEARDGARRASEGEKRAEHLAERALCARDDAEAERDAQKKAAGSLFARAERLAAERDALLEGVRKARERLYARSIDGQIEIEVRMGISQAVKFIDAALASSGSGGPGVHLTADEEGA